eukprot:TRINITY_DN13687_c0_g1_i2.p1 TRINITY_DN13687_c0_g1~~TRINITY_DN13687_c0_g1_i2.p1  ORF type:complete len:192 (-),score=1.05 TRINITY_DN13687_c0_g1_i2:54-629(-)
MLNNTKDIQSHGCSYFSIDIFEINLSVRGFVGFLMDAGHLLRTLLPITATTVLYFKPSFTGIFIYTYYACIQQQQIILNKYNLGYNLLFQFSYYRGNCLQNMIFYWKFIYPSFYYLVFGGAFSWKIIGDLTFLFLTSSRCGQQDYQKLFPTNTVRLQVNDLQYTYVKQFSKDLIHTVIVPYLSALAQSYRG